MFYSPIRAAELQTTTFYCLARAVAPSFKIRSYCTDDHGLHSALIPAVYSDQAGSGFLAAYLVSSDPFAETSPTKAIVDSTATYPDALAAAIAAHKLADDAAAAVRVGRPAPSDVNWAAIRIRSQPRFEDSSTACAAQA